MDEVTVRLSLAEDDADADRLEALTRQVRDELRQLDLRDVQLETSGAPPPTGARGIDASAVSGLLVALLGSQGLAAVLTAVRGWVGRGHDAPRTVRVEIDGDVLELTGATSKEQDQLVSTFLRRHAPEGQQPWTAGA